MSLAFALIVTATCVTMALLLFPTWQALYDRINQQLYWDLAENIREVLQPALLTSQSDGEIEKVFYQLSILHPGIEVFLLNEQGDTVLHGRLIDYGIDSLNRVDTKILHNAIEANTSDYEYLKVAPSDVYYNGPFSAAELLYKNQLHYLLIPLRSRLSYFVIRSSGERFMVDVVLAGALLIIAAAVLLAVFVFRYLTRHLRSLVKATEHFVAGDFSHRVAVDSADEVGVLAHSMNVMAEKITESERHRKELIANITHDLRTPLTSMSGFVETLLTQETDKSQRDRYLKIIASDIRTQKTLISDLFDLSRFDSPAFSPEFDYFRIEEMLDEFVMRAGQMASEKGLTVVSAVPQKLPLVWADIELIERVVQNLLQNAIRYSNQGGSISIGARTLDDKVEIEISDTGIGIPEDELSKIFESFYRVDKARTRTRGGTGLGLAIVKRILELHNSQVTITSVIEKGTSVRFTLATRIEDSENTSLMSTTGKRSKSVST